MMQRRDNASDAVVTTPVAPLPAAQGRPSVSVLGAGIGGNLLEWYDFGIYRLLAPVLAGVFFPAENRIAALIGAYGLFAAGFAMRPIGGIVLGHLGDRLGRRFVLIYTVVLMGLATGAIAVLPSYEKIGVAAPLLLLVLRLLQGFSVGGQFTGSVSSLVRRRHSIDADLPEASLISARPRVCCSRQPSPRQPSPWPAPRNSRAGLWRVPFLLGGVIAACGYFLRRRLRETGYRPLPVRPNDPIPLKQAITLAPGAMICAVLFTSGYGIVNYLTMVFLPVCGLTATQSALSRCHP